MLSSVIKDHQIRQKYRKEICERKRKDAMEAADQLTKVLVTNLNASVSQAYINQRRIDAEAKSLQAKVNRFTQQTQQWLLIADQFNSALKELGDVENWSKSVERDMRIVNDTLQSAYELHNRTVKMKLNQAVPPDQKSEQRSDPKSEQKVESKSEQKVESKSEQRSDPKSEQRSDPKSEQRSDPKSEQKADGAK